MSDKYQVFTEKWLNSYESGLTLRSNFIQDLPQRRLYTKFYPPSRLCLASDTMNVPYVWIIFEFILLDKSQWVVHFEKNEFYPTSKSVNFNFEKLRFHHSPIAWGFFFIWLIKTESLISFLLSIEFFISFSFSIAFHFKRKKIINWFFSSHGKALLRMRNV